MKQEIKPFLNEGVLIQRGYKFRIYPTPDQIINLEKTFGCVRLIYNTLLDQSIKEYEQYKLIKELNKESLIKRPDVSGFTLAKQITILKQNPDYAFLAEVSSCALKSKAHDLGKAFSNFFKTKKGFPQFKKKHGLQSFRLNHDERASYFKVIENKLYLPLRKDGIKIQLDRSLPSVPSSVTISKSRSGKYFASFLCKVEPRLTNGTGIIGIDLGLKDFIVTSDGIKINNPKFFNKSQQKLKRLQQSLSRKKKGSSNRNKARIKVAKCYEHISNQRNSFLHNLSRQLVNENQVIGIETLTVSNMIRNRKLSKAIQDVSWSTFIRMLVYKAEESSWCKIGYADRFYPSTHICNETRLKLDRKLKLSEREWQCPYCNQLHDRDINAACNIRDSILEKLTELKVLNMPVGKLLILPMIE